MDKALKPLNRQSAQIQLQYPERVVQFGGGNFLRAFIDWIIQELNEQTNFASRVVIVKPTKSGTYKQFDDQDGLFHVQLHGFQQGKLITKRKLITCVSRTINPYMDYEGLLTLACQPDIRFIISNTTESGLEFDPQDQLENMPPTSFPAKLTAFLYRRFQHFHGSPDKGCIILPCELVERNGQRLKALILQYSDLWQLENDFKHWIENNNHFCNTLVDRIVTGFPKQKADETLSDIGFNDQLLVEAETYHSWIIEAPSWLENELPVQWSNLNIHIVEDVEPHREIKVRILNGAHTAMMPLGYLLGLETVQQAVEYPWLGQFIKDMIYQEVIPSFASPDAALTEFAEATLSRFRNSFVNHRLLSIALNSISKFKVRLLPSLIAYTTKHHQLPSHIVFAFAALIRFYKGEWNGVPIPLNDDPVVMTWLQEQWHSCHEISALVTNILVNEKLWEQDLTQIEGLVDLLSAYLMAIDSQNIQLVIEDNPRLD